MMLRTGFVAAALVALSVAVPSRAHAASISWAFDYYTVNPHVAPHPLQGPGSFGTITLTDSTVDPNRVDIALTITPPAEYAGAGLEQFYLNFDFDPDVPASPNDPDFRTNHIFQLVDPISSATLGSVGYANGGSTYNFANFVFDLNPNPTSTALTFNGSLAVYNQLPNPDEQVNIDVSMFMIPAKTTGMQTANVWAAYRTHNGEQSAGEFWAFATSTVPPVESVPEPTTMVLVGVGLVGAALAGRRSRNSR